MPALHRRTAVACLSAVLAGAGLLALTPAARSEEMTLKAALFVPPTTPYGIPFKRFVDHVNDLEFHGLEGTRQSIAMYTSVLSGINITVQEQIVEGDRVTSRFVVSGMSFGRCVRFNGITISRFENGLIVEDWSVTDTLSLLRQLGPWRSVLAGLRQWRTLRAMRSDRPKRRVQAHDNGSTHSQACATARDAAR